MRILVLCIDRDDDIGRKGGISSPVIGREKVLKAAIALGVADPEDSDINSIMASVKVYDDMLLRGQDAEVVVLAGDKNVGYKSDQKITAQLDQILRDLQPDSAILVTDGAEDEQIFPIITSRIPVTYVESVIVKQSKSLESLYYIIGKAFKEPKTRNKIILPIILSLLLYGGMSFLGYQELALRMIFFILVPLYLLVTSFDLINRTRIAFDDAVRSLEQGRLVVITSALALFITFGGLAYAALQTDLATGNEREILSFLTIATEFVFVAAVVYEAGHLQDMWKTQARVRASFWIIMLLLLGVGIAGVVTLEALASFQGYSSPWRFLDRALIYLSAVLVEMTFGAYLTFWGPASRPGPVEEDLSGGPAGYGKQR